MLHNIPVFKLATSSQVSRFTALWDEKDLTLCDREGDLIVPLPRPTGDFRRVARESGTKCSFIGLPLIPDFQCHNHPAALHIIR
jgi:hypothetical protein